MDQALSLQPSSFAELFLSFYCHFTSLISFHGSLEATLKFLQYCEGKIIVAQIVFIPAELFWSINPRQIFESLSNRCVFFTNFFAFFFLLFLNEYLCYLLYVVFFIPGSYFSEVIWFYRLNQQGELFFFSSHKNVKPERTEARLRTLHSIQFHCYGIIHVLCEDCLIGLNITRLSKLVLQLIKT